MYFSLVKRRGGNCPISNSRLRNTGLPAEGRGKKQHVSFFGSLPGSILVPSLYSLGVHVQNSPFDLLTQKLINILLLQRYS